MRRAKQPECNSDAHFLPSRLLDSSTPQLLNSSLLAAREAVWRAWFAGDTDALGKLVPPELITIDPGTDGFGTHASTLAGSRGFAASGGKLTRLAFPRTEVQAYGTAILYTTCEMDLRNGGQTSTERGTATEMFVQRDGGWVNTGWQLSPKK